MDNNRYLWDKSTARARPKRGDGSLTHFLAVFTQQLGGNLFVVLGVTSVVSIDTQSIEQLFASFLAVVAAGSTIQIAASQLFQTEAAKDADHVSEQFSLSGLLAKQFKGSGAVDYLNHYVDKMKQFLSDQAAGLADIANAPAKGWAAVNQPKPHSWFGPQERMGTEEEYKDGKLPTC